jgi:hypothetical protein
MMYKIANENVAINKQATIETITEHEFLIFHYHSLSYSTKTRIAFASNDIWNLIYSTYF